MENFSMTDFNYFDVTISVIILILGIKGFMQGFIKELFALIGLVAGVYFAARLAPEAAIFIDTNFIHLENDAILKLIGFLAILTIIWLTATIVGSLFAKIANQNGMNIINRIFGFATALGKYFLIFALIVTALSNVTLVKDNIGKYIDGSNLYPYLKETGAYLINLDIPALSALKDSIKNTDKNTSKDIFSQY
ncbi:Colicin V production protein [hydrothermal vent metagenome]|uniref:Colicin V production protein n=1 Tax=hydrothermal vent metagenome TaxID=652676 RepID=A0A1W1CZK2_9ZZZZ